MRILQTHPMPPGIKGIGRVDVELDNGVRLYGMKLLDTPYGLRIHAANVFGRASATLPPEMASEIAKAARLALGATAFGHH